ncbi:MAG TPA: phosphate acyltransferase PlsX [Candidatus Micrarchaeia archaeon]|nr:phosphate acyltransferase PlsX [Candidatus Micrarchaeia archaeon]
MGPETGGAGAVRVALDAMGGDHGPAPLVAGAAAAVGSCADVCVTLVGDPVRLRGALAGWSPQLRSRLPIEAAGTVIPMGAHPAQAVRASPDASVAVAVRLVADGRAAAAVSAGNSGATMAAALLHLHRLPGIARPAIGTVLPTPAGPTLLVDAGAQVDCRPEWLAQFARLGVAYARHGLGVAQPTVGLLSNGEETGKGNQLVQLAHPILVREVPEYRGPVEGRDLLAGTVDVVVCDGFVGNVALKTAEGTAELLFRVLRQELSRGGRARLGALLLRPRLRAIRDRLDWRRTGGAPLLGVGGLVFVSHGRSDAMAIRSAVLGAAAGARDGRLVEALRAAAAGGGEGEPALAAPRTSGAAEPGGDGWT